jgi:hypothetical protein
MDLGRHDDLLRAVHHGAEAEVRRLLGSPLLRPEQGENQALRFAAVLMKPLIVRLLLNDPRVVPSADQLGWCIVDASACAQTLDVLLSHPRCAPTTKSEGRVHTKFRGLALWRACAMNKAPSVARLLVDPLVHVEASCVELLRLAARHPDARVMRALLSNAGIDPRAGNSYTLHVAVASGPVEVCAAMLADPRVATSSREQAQMYCMAGAPRAVNVHTQLLDQVFRWRRRAPWIRAGAEARPAS